MSQSVQRSAKLTVAFMCADWGDVSEGEILSGCEPQLLRGRCREDRGFGSSKKRTWAPNPLDPKVNEVQGMSVTQIQSCRCAASPAKLHERSKFACTII